MISAGRKGALRTTVTVLGRLAFFVLDRAVADFFVCAGLRTVRERVAVGYFFAFFRGSENIGFVKTSSPTRTNIILRVTVIGIAEV